MKMTQKITRDAILSLNSHSVYGSGLNCCSLHGKQKGQANTGYLTLKCPFLDGSEG